MESKNQKSKVLNIMFIGEQNVGKTSLINTFLANNNDNNYKIETPVKTTRADYFQKSLSLYDSVIKLKLWDTAGGLDAINSNRPFFKYAHCIILVASVDNKASIANINLWIQEIALSISKDISILFFLNKTDIEQSDWCFTKDEIQGKIKDFPKLDYYELSTNDRKSIISVFNSFIKKLNENINEVALEHHIFALDKESNSMSNTKSGKCCK